MICSNLSLQSRAGTLRRRDIPRRSLPLPRVSLDSKRAGMQRPLLWPLMLLVQPAPGDVKIHKERETATKVPCRAPGHLGFVLEAEGGLNLSWLPPHTWGGGVTAWSCPNTTSIPQEPLANAPPCALLPQILGHEPTQVGSFLVSLPLLAPGGRIQS